MMIIQLTFVYVILIGGKCEAKGCLKDGLHVPCKGPTSHCIISEKGKTGGCSPTGNECGTAQNAETLACDGTKNICCCKAESSTCTNKVTKAVRDIICESGGDTQFQEKPKLCSRHPDPLKCFKYNPASGAEDEEECDDLEAYCGLGFPGGMGCVNGGPYKNDLLPFCVVHHHADSDPGTAATAIPYKSGCYCEDNLCNHAGDLGLTAAIVSPRHGVPCDPSWTKYSSLNSVCLHWQEGVCRDDAANDNVICPTKDKKRFCKFSQLTGAGFGCHEASEDCKVMKQTDIDSPTRPQAFCDPALLTCCCPARSKYCMTEDIRTQHVCRHPGHSDKMCTLPICLHGSEIVRCGSLNATNQVKYACKMSSLNGESGGCEELKKCQLGCNGSDCCCKATNLTTCNDRTFFKTTVCKFSPKLKGCPRQPVKPPGTSPPTAKARKSRMRGGETKSGTDSTQPRVCNLLVGAIYVYTLILISKLVG